MADYFSEQAREALNLAYRAARTMNNSHIGTEHILLGLVRQGTGVAARVLAENEVTEKKLTMGHVRPLLALKDENEMYDAALHVLKNKMSVREVEKYVRELNGGKKKHVRRDKVKDPWIRDLEYRLSGKLGTKVEVTGKALTVSYSSTDDLNRILELLGCLEELEG